MSRSFLKKKKKNGTRACTKPNKSGTSNSCRWGPRKSQLEEKKKGNALAARPGTAGRPRGQLGSWLPPRGQPSSHLLLLGLPGNSGGAPFERKRRANQEVRGEPFAATGTARSLPFPPGSGDLRPGRTVGQLRPPFQKSPPVSTRDGRLRASGAKLSSCQPRQPARSAGDPPDTGGR